MSAEPSSGSDRPPQTLRRDGAIASMPRFRRGGLPPGPRTSHPAAAEVLPTTPFRGSDAVDLAPTVDPPPATGAYREAAEVFLNANRAAWNVQDYHELRPEVFETPKGAEVKYTVYQNGVPIVGMDIRIEVGNDRQVSGVHNGYSSVRPADLSQPMLDYQVILDRHQGRFSLDDASTSGVSKVLYLGDGADTPEMAFVVPVKDGSEGQASEVVFRASDGRVLGRRPPSGEL